jgi:hypothetical protein
MLEKTKGTIFIGESYGVRITVELERADIDIEDAFNAFSTILTGLSWSNEQIENWIIGKAQELEENKTI